MQCENPQLGRTVCLVDGRGLFHMTKEYDGQFDFNKLQEWLKGQYQMTQFRYMTRYTVDEEGHIPLQGLMDYLGHNGWSVESRETNYVYDGDEVINTYGNCEVDLALAMADLYHGGRTDHIVLVSNSSDLAHAVKSLVGRGMNITVMGTHKTTMELRTAASGAIVMDDNKSGTPLYETFLRERPQHKAR